jgi:hypothetical protein
MPCLLGYLTEHVKIGNPQKRELDNFGKILFFA